MKFLHLLGAVGALIIFTSTGSALEDFYVGTYTSPSGSKGIYHFQFDETAGTISQGTLAVEAANPSFLVIHTNRHWLYAVNEQENGMVSAFGIAADGQLQLLAQQSSRGSGPCHLTLDGTQRNVFVANYGSGSVAVLPVGEDGGLGAATGFDQHHGGSASPGRQEGTNAHSIYADPANRFVYSCDLGNDHVEGYRLNAAKGTIEPLETATAKIAPGSGPRHLVLHGAFVYVLNEKANTVTVLRRDADTGALDTLQTVPTLPEDFAQANATAEIAVHPNGKFLYASNRGHDSIAVFAMAEDGRLSLVQRALTGGKGPRHFSFDPSGRWLLAANQDSNDIFVFRVNGQTGELTPNGQKVDISKPVCVAFMPPK
jgi:6-phosphogluconolactonase